VVTHQLQVERRTAKAHQPKTSALPLDYATNHKVTWSVLLEAMFVARFVAAAFWRGCGQIFIAAASCATKVYVCHQGNGSYPVIDAVYFCANLWHCRRLFRDGGSVA